MGCMSMSIVTLPVGCLRRSDIAARHCDLLYLKKTGIGDAFLVSDTTAALSERGRDRELT